MYFLLNYDMMEGNKENRRKGRMRLYIKGDYTKEYLMAIWN